jgi:alpha-1,2-glucosyltransferase
MPSLFGTTQGQPSSQPLCFAKQAKQTIGGARQTLNTMTLATPWAVCASALWTGAHAVLLSAINEAVPEAYMDEPFHVGQTQAYCRGDWLSWDPKITTPPALYALATAAAHARNFVLTGELARNVVECDLRFLRAVNCAFSLGVLVLVAHLVDVLQGHQQQVQDKMHNSDTNNAPWRPWLHAMVLCASPTHLLYAFLFYTDVASLFFVLLAFACSLPRTADARPGKLLTAPAWPFVGGVSCAIAVGIRQTNVVWVCFVAGTVVLRRIQAQAPDADTSPFRVLRAVSGQLRWIVSQCWPHIAVVLLFIGFAIHNQGIVLGDKSNHQATLHGALVLYFFAVAMVFTGGIPAMLRALVPRTAAQAGCQVALNVAMAAVVHFLSHTHPFLLADNRHYTFYLWRKFFLRYSVAKYLPVPIYVASITSLARRLALSRSRLWSLMYVVCTVAVLVPTPLVEPRYFTVPLFVLGVHLRISTRNLVLTGMANVVVNAVTIYVFMFRTFEAPDGSIGRFMW